MSILRGRIERAKVYTVPRRLQFEQFRVPAALRQQFAVRAAGLQAPFVQHQDAVGHAHAGEAVRDQHRRAAVREFLEALEDLELAARIERGGGFVEDHHLRIAHVGARDRDLLPLAAGQVDAGAEAAADDLVVAVRQCRDHFIGERAPRRFFDALAVVHRVDLADADVLRRGEVVAHEVLEDHADVRAQVVEVVVAQIAAVEQDAAFVGVVQAREQFDERGLARAVLADEREHFVGAQFEIQAAQRPALGFGIAEADAFEHEAARDRARDRDRVGLRANLRHDLEERIQIVEVQRLAGDLREADEQTFEQLPQAAEAAGEERQVADAEIALAPCAMRCTP